MRLSCKVNAETGRRTCISKEEVQAEHEEVKKQISLLKLQRLRRELHRASDVEFYLSDMLSGFKNRLLSLPSKMAMEVSGETDPGQIARILQKDLLDTLEELSGYDADEIDHNTGDGADEDDDEDDETDYDESDDDETGGRR